MEKTKFAAIDYINNGGKCYYQYGFSYRGVSKQEITKEKALEYISKPSWSFGMGFYELRWDNKDNTLVFNEYSEHDLD